MREIKVIDRKKRRVGFGNPPLVLAYAMLCIATQSPGQISGFASASYGYHSNPLYNSESLADRLLQGYIEIQHRADWSQSFLSTSYVGGLMLFDRISDRTYYEHSGQMRYAMTIGKPKRTPPTPKAASEEESGEEEGEEEEKADLDSVASYLELGSRLSARYDKQVFSEFDNMGIELKGSWRFHLGPKLFARVSDVVGYRSYINLEALSNLNNQTFFEIGAYTPNGFSYGCLAGFGIKSFIKATYDTSLFTTPAEIAAHGQGKGKGGAKLVGGTSKKVLANANRDLSTQLSVGLYAVSRWEKGSLRLDLDFRSNLGSTGRYLAQYANSTFLNEDIYNDHFSYGGPGGKLTFQHTLPGELQVTINAVALRKTFAAPGLALDGTQVADNRIDLHGSVEMGISRYLALSEAIGLDVGITGSLARNQSNDDYNDYSVHSVAVSIGMGW